MIPVEYTMQQLHHCCPVRSLLHAAAVSVPYSRLAAATPLLPLMLHAATVSVPYHSSWQLHHCPCQCYELPQSACRTTCSSLHSLCLHISHADVQPSSSMLVHCPHTRACAAQTSALAPRFLASPLHKGPMVNTLCRTVFT
jgi:hypothetical protein